MFTIKVATMKITEDNFCCEWKPSHAYHKSTLFAVSKDEEDIKEGTDKSMKSTLYVQVQWYGKRHFSS